MVVANLKVCRRVCATSLSVGMFVCCHWCSIPCVSSVCSFVRAQSAAHHIIISSYHHIITPNSPAPISSSSSYYSYYYMILSSKRRRKKECHDDDDDDDSAFVNSCSSPYPPFRRRALDLCKIHLLRLFHCCPHPNSCNATALVDP